MLHKVWSAAIAIALLSCPATAAQGVIPWTAMAEVKESMANGAKSITYSSALDALDGQVIQVKGYRIPLEVKTRFLVAAKPSDCESCIEGGPESYVEVFSKQPVQPTFGKPLTVSGRLELLRGNPTGSYYRLRDATVVSVD